MSEFFLTVVNMSISASWIVLAVLILRLLLKKAPKWITVLLWGIVAVRLICPFSIESVMSLIPSAETINPEILVEQAPVIDPSVPVMDGGVEIPVINGTNNGTNNGTDTPVVGKPVTPVPDTTPVDPVQTAIPVLSYVWLAGVAGMLAYTVISYFRVKGKIGTAVRLRDNIFQSERVVSPFVLGLIKPKIYLPFHMNGQDMDYVIAHENAHIRRKDHWWKPIGFLILTIHWFNPLLWLGYVLLCRDIELACDEKVIKTMDAEQKADYSQALLNCSVNRRILAACPLAFGEVGVKDRVKSVLSYKKPAFWIIVVAIVASVVAAVCFLTDPVDKTPDDTTQQTDPSDATENTEPSDATENTDPIDVIDSLTEKFLKGEISATNKEGRKVSIQNYLRGDYNKYALYDMSGDAVPELIIKTGNGLTIFNVRDQGLTVWYQGTIYEKPLNNRAIFYERPGGAPEHTDYQYIVLDHNGEELQRTSFVESYGDNAEYFINGERVSKTAYEDLYKSFDLSDDAIVWKDILPAPNQSTAYDKAIAAYYAFLNGQIAAIAEDNSKIFISGYTSISNGQSGIDRYALHDVNGDDIPELFIDAATDHILAFDGENIAQWYSSMSWMGIQLLKNGAVVDTHSGAGSFIKYLTFGPDGIEKYIFFSGGPGGESGQYYYAEGIQGSFKEVSKDEWEALTEPYFQQMENKAELEWHTTIPTTPNNGEQIYPTITFQVNSSRPEYTAVVNYSEENPGIAQSVTITDLVAKKDIQTISLSGNELFTQSVIYAVDVTFDGNLDILIPYQQPASAAYFQAYVWQESESQFVYAPQFEDLPNFIIDKENNRILSTRTASQITSYSISYYDAEAKDFRPSHSLYWEPDTSSNQMYFVEQRYENGTAVTVKDCLVEKISDIDVNKSDPQIAEYFSSNSFWDLDSQKWKDQFYKPGATEGTKTAAQAYAEFLSGHVTDTSLLYFTKDIDNNGTEELFIDQNTAIEVYTYENAVKKVGVHDFITGTLLLHHTNDKKYPGIVYVTVGGGKEHFGYITITDGALSVKQTFDNDYGMISGEKEDVFYTDDEELIAISRKVFEDLFYRIGYSVWEPTTTEDPYAIREITDERVTIEGDTKVFNNGQFTLRFLQSWKCLTASGEDNVVYYFRDPVWGEKCQLSVSVTFKEYYKERTREEYLESLSHSYENVVIDSFATDNIHGFPCTKVVFSYTEDNTKFVGIRYLNLIEGPRLYDFCITCPAAESEAYEKAFAAIMNSVRFLTTEKVDISSLPLDEAYAYAGKQYKEDPLNHRFVCDLQPETQQIIKIDGKYYQSYVASNVDVRYIWISQVEFPDNNTALWDWYAVGSSQVYSLDLLGKIDEGRVEEPDKIDVADMDLLSTLYNKSPFITQKGTTVYLNAYKPYYKHSEDKDYYEKENVFVPQEYTFVDLDKDGKKELIVSEAPYADTYLILREENKNIYGYSLPNRGFLALKQDGSFQGSGGALIHDYNTISFSQNTYQISTIAKFYFEADDKKPVSDKYGYAPDYEKSVFEINGKPVSFEEIEQFAEQWENRPGAVWMKLT